MAKRGRSFVLRASVRRSLMVAAALQATFGTGNLQALPTGGQAVVPGSAQIGVPVNNALTVTNQPGAIINWQSFSIAPSELVKFVQQNAASAVLNRVTGPQMSEIMGRLQSNGRVFLINPNGIVVGPGAVIDVAAFIGSTLPMLDRDFLDGKLRFQGDAASGGRIVNQGAIRAGFGGKVLLVAPHIENAGLIEAPGGEILLAAGKSVTITPLSSSGVSFELQAPTDSVVNIGQLIADGGAVRAFAGSLRHSGDIRANALTRDAAGHIVLQGSSETRIAAGSTTRAEGRIGGTVQIDSAGSTRVEGTVTATGSSGGGGRIEVLGDRVVLAGDALLDASGAAGGGTVLVGGDWQGANANVRNAASTFVGAGVSLKADAQTTDATGTVTGNGDGGKVVVWADGNTRFLGKVMARGGPQGGNGGVAEVSGRGELLFIGGADLGAPRGQAGSLLLDPLDLFVDLVGGLNPFIIDEATDFPNNAVTVSPATLAAITGNVTLFASRDLRFNSNVTLTGAGQSLSAIAGRDLQLGSTLTTNNGAVSLAATRSITTFGTPSIAAGSGAVSATTAGGALALGSVASAGSVNVASTGGTTSTTGITAIGPVTLSSTGVISATGAIATGGGALTLNASGSISTAAITTNGGNATLSGTSISTGTLNTTGNATLTASAGNISSTIDNATSVTANASRSFSSVSITLNSTTTLNATSVNATASNCLSAFSCPGASINLSGTQGVNIGTVVASAPSTTNNAAPFNSISESVSVTSSAGSIRAMSAASQVSATNVTLSTNALSGGGIGTAALPLQVDVDRALTFRPNGDFAVTLTGSGPNQLTFQPGVAPAGQSWTGTMSGLVNAAASATDTTVTFSSFSATGGFNDLVFNSSPFITLNVPNGNLVVNTMTVPAGDQTGRVPPFSCCNVIQGLPVTVSASGALTVSNYTRSAGASAKSTAFTASGGALVLGTIAGDHDPITASGRDSVTVSNLSTAGNVTVTSSPSATAFGNVTIDRINSANGNVSVTGTGGTIEAANDGVAAEITAAGSVTLSAASLGSAGFASPLDVAGASVALTANGVPAGTGFIGSGATPTNPVTAATSQLTVNATRQFNVTTGAVPLVNLTVTASPTGVTAGGLARVVSDGTTFAFNSDGTDFTVSNLATTTQFLGGTLDFRSTSGSIDFGTIDFSATNGSLALRAQQDATGDVTRVGGPVTLGTGTLTVRADRDVALGDLTLGSASVSNSNGSSPGPGPCETIGGSFVCATNTLTVGNITGAGTGAFSVLTRRAILTGNLDGLQTVDLTARSGGIMTGTLGSAATPVNNLTLNTNFGTGNNIATGAIEANALNFQAQGTISTGGAAINAGAAATGTNVFISAPGAVSLGTVNSASTVSGAVTLRSDTSVNAGTLQGATVNVTPHFLGSPNVTVGAIGGIRPGTTIGIQGNNVSVGAMTLDGAAAGTVFVTAGSGITLGGPILAQGGSTVILSGNGTGALQFSTIDGGAGGSVSITNPNGITQTLAAASGGGIKAAAVTLSAAGTSAAIVGPGAAPDNGRMTLRGVTQLSFDVGGDVKFSLVDAAGSAPGPELTNLDITRAKNDGAFVFNGLPGTQTLTLTDTGSGTRIDLDSAGSATALAFGYRNNDTAGTIEVTNILTNGGPVTLAAPNGDLQIAQIDTRGAGSGAITMSTGGTARFTNVVDSGTGSISVVAVDDILRSAAPGELRSTGTVSLTAGSEIGRTAAAERFRINGAPGVSLDGAEIYADLTGTVDLTARVGNAFSVANSVDLSSLDLTIDATGSGATSLTTATQSFGLSRAAGRLDIGTVSSSTPLSAFRLRTSSGDMRVLGTGSNSISANSLLLQSAGILRFDGTASPVVLSNVDQDFFATGELKVDGRGTLTATGAQNFQTFGVSDILFAASGGAIVVTAPSQSLTAGRDIHLFGGSGSGDSVSVTASAVQTLTAGAALELLAGTGALSSVTVASSGGGRQTLQASGNLIATGGGTGGGSEASTAMISQSGTGGQLLQARGSVILTGGIGGGGSALVENTGTGAQNIGDPFVCCDFYRTDTVTLQGGAGTGSSVEIRSTGAQQFIEPFNALNVVGGSGNGAHARIASTSASEQWIGAPNYFCCSRDPVNTIALTAGSGTNAFAEITASAQQRVTAASSMTLTGSGASGGYALLSGAGQDIRTGATSLVAGTGQGANAEILSSGALAQFLDPASLVLTAGGSAGSNTASARIVSGGSQQISFTSPTTLTGGVGPDSIAEIRSATSQSLSLGNLTLTGGTGAGARAQIVAGASQVINASTTLLAGGTGAAGAGRDASALITNAAGSQFVSTGNLTLRSGADYATAGIVNDGTNQTVSAGSILISTTAGANNLDTPIATNHYAAIAQAGSGTQTVNASSVTVDNTHAPGRIGIVNRGTGQTLGVSGSINVLASGGSGTATIDTHAGTQTVRADGGIVVRASGGSGLAQIANTAGAQTFTSASGGVQVQATGGSGTAKISAAGAQSFSPVRSLEASTGATASGNAEITAGGNQTIHTTNGTVAGFSLKAVALGTGTAKIEAGGNQLIEADYPELMQADRDGRIFIGDPAGLGPAFIRGVNQDIFARAILIRGGASAASTAKLDASGTQTISILTPRVTPTPIAAGITVAGGAGGSASLDPVLQTIVSNGQIAVFGGSGLNAFGQILSGGPQTILVTAPGTPDSVLIQGGSGQNAFAAITSTDPSMLLGTSGGITLTGGSNNGDAVFGNGANVTLFACGASFTCTFANLIGNPFTNPGVDVGIANNGVSVSLSAIIALLASSPAASTTLPFDFSNILLGILDQSSQTLDGDLQEEQLVALLGRRLPLCR